MIQFAELSKSIVHTGPGKQKTGNHHSRIGHSTRPAIQLYSIVNADFANLDRVEK